MTLQYQLEINGKKNLFPEKIIRSLDIPESKKWTLYDLMSEHITMNVGIKDFQELTPKIHSIRQDDNNRWKVGNKIHNKIWIGKPYHSEQFQFTPVLKTKTIQNIKIVWDKPNFNDMHGLQATNHKDRLVYVYVDNLVIYGARLFDLIRNDGFDTIADFFEWFNQDFEGKIIHWTDFRY